MTAKIPTILFPPSNRNIDGGENAIRQYHAEFSLNTVAPHPHSIFKIDQSSMRPQTAKSSHWSIAWSDLMMTMFILFLSLFVYQATHKDFLIDKKTEVLGGETVKAIDLETPKNSSLPFMPIEPAAPFITSGTVRKVEQITLQEIDLESTFSSPDIELSLDEIANTPIRQIPAPPKSVSAKPVALKPEPKEKTVSAAEPIDAIIQPLPIGMTSQEASSVNKLYNKGQQTLETNMLNDFATINLVPNKALRIVLTGDLLFETGHASLSLGAINSLEKIASTIRSTDYQIHIEGHTDDIPIRSGVYANNWELSLARANAVAVFMIKDMDMDPGQFVVSGYSSYKPVAPNDSDTNRALNRRVEIVISEPPAETRNMIFDSPITTAILP